MVKVEVEFAVLLKQLCCFEDILSKNIKLIAEPKELIRIMKRRC